MEHLNFNWHLSKFIEHCKKEIHMLNVLKAKAILIGGAGLKMLVGQSLMIQLAGVKMLALKTRIVKLGLVAAVTSGSLFSSVLGTYAAGGFTSITVSPEGEVLVERGVDVGDPVNAIITSQLEGTPSPTIQYQGVYNAGETSFTITEGGTYTITLEGFDDQGTIVHTFEENIEYIPSPVSGDNIAIELISLASPVEANPGDPAELAMVNITNNNDEEVILTELIVNGSNLGEVFNDPIELLNSQGGLLTSASILDNIVIFDLGVSIPANSDAIFTVFGEISDDGLVVGENTDTLLSGIEIESLNSDILISSTDPVSMINNGREISVVDPINPDLITTDIIEIVPSNVVITPGSQNIDALKLMVTNENDSSVFIDNVSVLVHAIGEYDFPIDTISLRKENNAGYELVNEYNGVYGNEDSEIFSQQLEVPGGGSTVLLFSIGLTDNPLVAGSAVFLQAENIDINSDYSDIFSLSWQSPAGDGIEILITEDECPPEPPCAAPLEGCAYENITYDNNNCPLDCGTLICEPFCGNGILEEGEECDDGNNDNNDGCNMFCMIGSYSSCSYIYTANDITVTSSQIIFNNVPNCDAVTVDGEELSCSNDTATYTIPSGSTMVNAMVGGGNSTCLYQFTLDVPQGGENDNEEDLEQELSDLLELLAETSTTQNNQAELSDLLESLTETQTDQVYLALDDLSTELDPDDLQVVVESLENLQDIAGLRNDPEEYVLQVRRDHAREGINRLIHSSDEERTFGTLDEDIEDIEFIDIEAIENAIIEAIDDVSSADANTIRDTLLARSSNGSTISHFELLAVFDDLDEDSDGDGIPDIVENSVGNNGDANYDGTLDRLQRNVSTIPTIQGDRKITIDTTLSQDCDNIIAYTTTSQETIGLNDEEYSYPYGLNRFELACDEATIRIYYHDVNLSSLRRMKYRKYDSEVGYFDLPVTYGRENGVTYVEFTIQDGSIYDDSPAGDGIIIDDNGPASETQNSFGGVASSITTVQVPRPIAGNYKIIPKEKTRPQMKPKIELGTHHTRSKQEHGSALEKKARSVLSSFKKLVSIDIVAKYQNTSLFSGKTLEFYKMIMDSLISLSFDDQVTKLESMTANLERLSEDEVAEYGISKSIVTLLFRGIINYSK